METKQNNGGKICLYCFLVVAAILGIIAFIFSLTKKCGEGFDANELDNKIPKDELDDFLNETDLDKHVNKGVKLLSKYHGIHFTREDYSKLKQLLLDAKHQIDAAGLNKHSEQFKPAAFSWTHPSRLTCFSYYCGKLNQYRDILSHWCNIWHSGVRNCVNQRGCGVNGSSYCTKP